ncbi:zf-HC2 domain-containing protein [Streptantibioticus parmotrematis]|uniref:zf-HC2 domain-containing protein n=1 Tax=Streptantibioticus parmotrematis TaxID=2873249 RepID=UPI0033F8685A
MTADQRHHVDVGAYALGLLDEAEAGRFEEHLAGCGRCADLLEDFVGLEALLAVYVARQDAGACGTPRGPGGR